MQQAFQKRAAKIREKDKCDVRSVNDEDARRSQNFIP
jgi:hypothetical protein